MVGVPASIIDHQPFSNRPARSLVALSRAVAALWQVFKAAAKTKEEIRIEQAHVTLTVSGGSPRDSGKRYPDGLVKVDRCGLNSDEPVGLTWINDNLNHNLNHYQIKYILLNHYRPLSTPLNHSQQLTTSIINY